MASLVERYVHQVGNYLPQKERAEVEAELRSQIQDQLEDRYGESPSATETALVLAELGEPRQMAVSYSGEQYLVGPDLYPTMRMVLRHGWVLVPSIVVFLSVFGALISVRQTNVVNLFFESFGAILQATLWFSATVVAFFAILEHSDVKVNKKKPTFDPLKLPKIDDPRVVDRFEAASGVAAGTFFSLIFLYFLRVGGLTLTFDLTNQVDIIPVPIAWLMLLIVLSFSMNALHLITLIRDFWSAGFWAAQTVFEVLGMVCLYFVLYKPILERLLIANPSLADLVWVVNAPEIIVAVGAIITLLGRGSKLVKLWNTP